MMLNKIIQIVGLLFFGIAVWLIGKEVEHVGFQNLAALVLGTPFWVIGLVVLFTAADYVALSGYDVLSLRFVRKRLPYRQILEASGVGFAVSNTTGHAYLAGGAVRYLFYIPEGMTKTELALFVAFESLTILIGMGATFVVAMTVAPFESALSGYASMKWFYLTAIGVIVGFSVYFLKWVRTGRVFRISGVKIQAPSLKMTLKQIGVGLMDNIAVFCAFYAVLLYHVDAPLFLTFVIFMIAQMVGISTQVPGGLGVFEGLFLLLFPHSVSVKGGVLASLIVFRVIYYFVPFLVATGYLIGRFVWRRMKKTSLR